MPLEEVKKLIEIQIQMLLGRKRRRQKSLPVQKERKHLLRALQRKRKLQIKNDIKFWFNLLPA